MRRTKSSRVDAKMHVGNGRIAKVTKWSLLLGVKHSGNDCHLRTGDVDVVDEIKGFLVWLLTVDLLRF